MSVDHERRRHLWRLLEEGRGGFAYGDLRGAVEYFARRGEQLDYDDLAYLAQRMHRTGSLVPPSYLCRFVGELLASREALSVLDPAAGQGWLAARVSLLSHGTQVQAVTDDPLAMWLFDYLGLTRVEIASSTPTDAAIDAIVAMPPVGGGRQRFPLPNAPHGVSDDPSLIRMLEVCHMLADDGLFAWIVPPRFAFDNSSTSVRRNLRHFDLHLQALLQIPSSAFAPSTSMGFDLAILGRQEYPDLFVAAIPEDDRGQDELIARLRSRQEGSDPAQGRIVPEKTFYGLGALEAAERAKRLADRRGLLPSPFSVLLIDIKRPRRRPQQPIEHPEPHPDAVYLPEMARTPATTSPTDLPENLQSYLQLIVDTERVVPEYLASLFNTPLGLAIRDGARAGTTMPRITPDRLSSSTVYLPPIEVQRKVVGLQASIRLLRMEVDELQEQLWDRPRQAARIRDRLAQVNHEDRFTDWVETLPFPLASILRVYGTVDRDAKAKYERLLHFFEALSAYIAIVHLSALRHDDDLWSELSQSLSQVFAEQHFRWSHPTFGLWNAVVQSAVGIVRPRWTGKDEERARIVSLYACQDSAPIELLIGRDLLTCVQTANARRNRWVGHTGAVSPEIAGERHSELANELERFRRAAGGTFSHYQIIIPSGAEILDGPIYRCEVHRAMGSNPQFERDQVDLITPAINNQLYLHNPGNNSAIELIRLVQISRQPQPACYFYNRLDGRIAHSVSYHFGDVPEISESSEDIVRVLDGLA